MPTKQEPKSYNEFVMEVYRERKFTKNKAYNSLIERIESSDLSEVEQIILMKLYNTKNLAEHNNLENFHKIVPSLKPYHFEIRKDATLIEDTRAQRIAIAIGLPIRMIYEKNKNQEIFNTLILNSAEESENEPIKSEESAQIIGNQNLKLSSTSLKTTPPTTILSKLRDGAKEYFNNQFNTLTISNSLFADIHNATLNVKVNSNGKELPIFNAIEELWGEDFQHAIILAEGGSGKTFSSMKIMENYLTNKNSNESCPIPIFIPLNFYNTEDIDKENFIIDYIFKYYLLKSNHNSYDEDELIAEFRRPGEGKKPNILLILDGMNEISVSTAKLRSTLKHWLNSYKGVQIVITSRYEMKNVESLNKATILFIEPLRIEQIQEYLKCSELEAPNDRNLLKVLSNPLMLTIFAQSCQIIKNASPNDKYSIKSKPTAQGEILYNFIELHLVKLHNEADGFAQGNIVEFGKEWHRRKFLLWHLLPFIGNQMEKEGLYFYNHYDLCELINIAYYIFGNSKHFTETFSEFYGQGIFTLNNEDPEEWALSVLIEITEQLHLIEKIGDNYQFKHQFFRDFFSAVHIANTSKIELSLSKKKTEFVFNNDLINRILPIYIRRMVGEITSEHKWQNGEKPTLLIELLDKARGIYDPLIIRNFVLNIIATIQEVRTDTAGYDLCRLYLIGTDFFNIKLSHKKGEGNIATVFDQSLLNYNSFFPKGHSNLVVAVDFSPCGKYIVTGSWDGMVKLWLLEPKELIQTFKGHTNNITGVAFSPNGEKILSSSSDHTIRIWDIANESSLPEIFEINEAILSVSYSANGKKFIAALSSSFTVIECEIETKKIIHVFKGHSKAVFSARYSPCQKKIISGSQDGRIIEFDIDSGTPTLQFQAHSKTVSAVNYHPGGNKIISCSHDDKIIREWNLTGKEISLYEGHEKGVYRVLYNKLGNRVLSASADKTIKEWDSLNQECIQTYTGHTNIVRAIAYSPNNERFLSGSNDCSFKVWNVDRDSPIISFEPHNLDVNSLPFAPSIKDGETTEVTVVSYNSVGNRIFTGSIDSSIKEWDVAKRRWVKTYREHNGAITSLKISPDGHYLVSCSKDCTILLWDLFTGKFIQSFIGHTDIVSCVAFSHDGTKIVSGSWDQQLIEWDVNSGSPLGSPYPLLIDSVTCVDYNKDGTKLITSVGGASKFCTIQEWSVNTHECIKSLEIKCGMIAGLKYCSLGRNIIFSPVSKKIEGIDVFQIEVYNLATGECIKTFESLGSRVFDFALNHDGTKVIVGLYNGKLKIIDFESTLCIAEIEAHINQISSVMFNPTGDKVVSSSIDGTIKEWRVDNFELLNTFKNIDGVFVEGCSFKNIHTDSITRKEEEEILKIYGAIIE